MSDSSVEVPIISKRRLTHLELIGEGAFGEAFKATLRQGPRHNPTRIEVAVKILKDSTDDESVWAEADKMIKLDHPNILKLFGVTTTDGFEAPWLITEYMEGGDLLSFIRNNTLTANLMVKFAYGIARGMAYLHHYAVEKHCDLAARNCFVGPNGTIKIGDFGKFETENEDCYYDDGRGIIIPLRWMAPENVYGPQFTRKGDVWAYGIVLFEIWTKGRRPYEDLDNEEVRQALEDGENPGTYRTVKARGYILELMDDCWEQTPMDRPNFKYIKRQFEENDSEIISSI